MQLPPKAHHAWRALSVVLAGSVVVWITSTGSPAYGTGLLRPDPQVGIVAVRLLQLNLCGSGFADCFTGRSMAEAAAVIHAQAPDLVTLNEVCQDDVAMLGRALDDVVPGAPVATAFQAALDRRGRGSVRCRDGQPYGIGVLSRWPLAPGSSIDEGIYPAELQDRRNSEGRAWLCLDTAAQPAVTVCTTHLANSSAEIAGGQCRYLFDTVIARLRARAGAAAVVLGADLNLAPDDSATACPPPGFAHVDDAGVQQVVGTSAFVMAGATTIDMHGATDHPALLATLARGGPTPRSP